MNIIESTGQKRRLASAVFLAAFILSSLALPEMCAKHGLALPVRITNLYALLLDLMEKSAAVLAAVGWVHPAIIAGINKAKGGK